MNSPRTQDSKTSFDVFTVHSNSVYVRFVKSTLNLMYNSNKILFCAACKTGFHLEKIPQLLTYTSIALVLCISRHMSRHMSRHLSRHMSRHMSRHISRHMSRHILRHMCRHMSRHMSRHVPTHVKTHVQTWQTYGRNTHVSLMGQSLLCMGPIVACNRCGKVFNTYC